jgi:major vault protein
VIEIVAPKILTDQQAVRLSAMQGFKDSSGVERSTGEEWLVRGPGAYVPDVYEKVAIS